MELYFKLDIGCDGLKLKNIAKVVNKIFRLNLLDISTSKLRELG